VGTVNMPDGRYFTIQMFDDRPPLYAECAAGTVHWDSAEGGVVLTRGHGFGNEEGAFNLDRWCGYYRVYRRDNDFVHFLNVTGMALAGDGSRYTVTCEYDGAPVTAEIQVDRPHILRFPGLEVPVLHYHSWEVGLASGLEVVARAYSYIGNYRTHELHVPSCTWVAQMKSHNKAYFSTINAALQQGYNGCTFCLPQYDTG
jgi:hypothetical protein